MFSEQRHLIHALREVKQPFSLLLGAAYREAREQLGGELYLAFREGRCPAAYLPRICGEVLYGLLERAQQEIEQAIHGVAVQSCDVRPVPEEMYFLLVCLPDHWR